MLAEIETLLTLQDRDQRIRNLKLELEAIPGEKTSKEKQIAASAARLDAAKTRLRAIELERKNLQLEAETKRGQIARYKTQQLETRKNEQFAALGHEIDTAERNIRDIEDRELDLMEETEALQPACVEAERAHGEERTKLEAQISDLEQKRGNVETSVAELRASRPTLTDGIDEELLEQYDRIFKGKNGTAIVELESGNCTGCHVKVTTQTVISTKAAKEIVHCPNCSRMLYMTI